MNRVRLVFALLAVIVAPLLAAPVVTPSAMTAVTIPSQPTVVRIYFHTPEQLGELTSTLDVWEVHHQDGYLIALVSPVKFVVLTGQGYTIEIDEVKTAQVNEVRVPLPGQVNAIPGYPCYRTVEETYQTYDTLIATYPTLITKQDIGDSWDKVTPGGPAGYDIWVVKVTNSAIPGPKPRFFLMGEIHAREYTTAETATRLVEYLLQNYGVDPDATWLLDTCEIHVVPMSNPDGRKFAENGQSWRKNTDNDDGCSTPGAWGTDLNRNHTFKWNQGGSSGAPCDETYRGPSAGSEPEVQAVQAYVAGIFPDQRGPGDSDPAPADATGAFITLHSYGGLVLWPWGHTAALPPNSTALQTLGRKIAFFNNYDPEQSVGLYPTSGTSDDWAYGELGVAAYTIEQGTSFFQDCGSFTSTIWPTNRDALLYAFKACRRPYQTPAGPEPINVAVSPAGVLVGGTVMLTAIVDDTRYRSGSGEPTQNIAEAHFSPDAPSFVAGTPTYPMTASDGSFNSPSEVVQAIVATTGWTPGRHLLVVEGKDAAGNWGVPGAASVCVSAAASSVGVAPSADARTGNPGVVVAYTLTVANLGSSDETFSVALQGNSWPTATLSSIGPLAPCATAALTVAVTIPADALACATDQVTVTVTSTGNSASATLTTTVNPAQGQPITAPASVCASSEGNAASIPDAGAGATYAWTIAGGTITAGADASSITFAAGTTGVVSLRVIVGQGALCYLSGPTTVAIVAPPTPAITGATSLCSGSTLTLTANPANLASYAWARNGVPIPGATQAIYEKSDVTVADAGAYTVTATNASGCSGVSPQATVVIASQPAASVADIAIAEGNSGNTDAVFTVWLSVPACIQASVAYQVLAGTATAGSDFQTSSGTLIFAAGQRTQAIHVPVFGDRITEADETFSVILSGAVNMDISRGEATGVILNDDAAGISVTPTSGLTCSEAGTAASFKIALTSQPTADVTISLISSDLTEGRVPASATLTAANWLTGVSLAVTGVDDFFVDGDQQFTIVTGAAASGDPFYAGLNPPDVAVTNLDDDFAGFVVSPTSGLRTTEDGGTATFVVALTSQPAADVTLPLAVSIPSEASIAPATLTFHPGDWSIPRLVTVTGLADGTPRSYAVITGPASSGDAMYQGLNPADVALTNLGAGVGTTERVGLAVDEHSGAGSSSILNGVFEVGEAVIVEPTWRNTRPTAKTPVAALFAFTGPGMTGEITRATAIYPNLAPGGSGSCYDPANPQSCYALHLRVPAARPFQHWDLRADETVDGIPTTWILHVGESFTDVPRSHWAYSFVETIYHNGITSGCGAALYCPDTPLSRAEMAVLLLMAEHGSGWTPPLSTGTVFTDVPIDHWAGDFIEALAAEGITSGCGAGNYCPDHPITRAEMAVFLLAAEHGQGWTPPLSTGTIFSDVPIDHWAGDFIEALAAEGITGGCGGGNYCPDSPVTRAEMAVFLTATFNLKLY